MCIFGGFKTRGKQKRFKAQVILATILADRTSSERATAFGLHSAQISQWKTQLLNGAVEVLADSRQSGQVDQKSREAELFQHIGKLLMELDWLKKNLSHSIELKRTWIEPKHRKLSIRRQCDLLQLNRSIT